MRHELVNNECPASVTIAAHFFHFGFLMERGSYNCFYNGTINLCFCVPVINFSTENLLKKLRLI